MSEPSLGATAGLGLEGHSGEVVSGPVVFISVIERTFLPRPTGSLSLLMGCQQPGRYMVSPLWLQGVFTVPRHSPADPLTLGQRPLSALWVGSAHVHREGQALSATSLRAVGTSAV